MASPPATRRVREPDARWTWIAPAEPAASAATREEVVALALSKTSTTTRPPTTAHAVPTSPVVRSSEARAAETWAADGDEVAWAGAAATEVTVAAAPRRRTRRRRGRLWRMGAPHR